MLRNVKNLKRECNNYYEFYIGGSAASEKRKAIYDYFYNRNKKLPKKYAIKLLTIIQAHQYICYCMEAKDNEEEL